MTRPTRRASGAHLSISLAMKAVNSSGVIARVSIASRSSRLRTSGSARTLTTAALSLLTISAGTPAGPDTPNQVVATRSG